MVCPALNLELLLQSLKDLKIKTEKEASNSKEA
jgi:hypothetical protein